jgi:hypothetical protein
VATDVEAIVRSLTGFYPFTDRTVVAVGAGTGQLAEYGRAARQVIAVDKDAASLQRLAMRLADRGLSERFTLVPGDFLSMVPSGDVVLLEFCLHQMPDPGRSLSHARGLAPDVLVIDHAPGSPWSWYAAEDEGVAAAWAEVARRPVRRRLDVDAVQVFAAPWDLEARMVAQGPTSRERIRRFRGRGAVSIPMPYRLVLL